MRQISIIPLALPVILNSERAGRQAGYGFSAYGERKLARRFSLGGGYAQLDRLGLYSDRFNVGRRIFWNSHIALGPKWSVMALATYAIAGSPGTAPRNPVRPDRGIQRSVSPALRRTLLRDQ